MSKLEREIQIDASPEDVYDKLTDPNCLGEWVSVHDGIEAAPPGNVEQGDTLIQRMKVAGRRFRITWHVDEAQRPSRVVWTGKGPMGSRSRATYLISTNGGDGSTFNYVNEYHLPGGPVGKLAARAVIGASGGEADRSLAKLKQLVENGAR